MVLASNEWHSLCDDESKADTVDVSTTSTPNPATTTRGTTAQIISAAETTGTNCITGPTISVAATSTGTAPAIDSVSPAQSPLLTPDQRSHSPHAVSQQIEELPLLHSTTSSPSVNNQPELPVPSPLLEGTNNLKHKIMADDPRDSLDLKNEANRDIKCELNESDNNNLAYLTSADTEPVEPLTTPKQYANNSNIELNTNDLSYSSSELSASLTVIDNSISPSLTFSGDTPISSQALSSALESVMSTNVANNLQNNFLSTLGIGPANGVLQQSANNTLNAAYCAALESQSQLPNGPDNAVPDNNGQARIVLSCEANSHPFQTRSILLTPNIECKVGRLIAKSKAAETNAIFDCKVLSRNHAVLWFSDDGKFWVKDTNSSNGTFINDNKLGIEAAELHFNDIVKFGVDVLENSRKEVHGCIIACVKLYLPDGREAITIDSNTYRSAYSGEGRISFDEMHRLNQYMQETSQREKVLKSKLCNVQNMLDATRKNSGMCWQAMIGEDQLLHRIHTLEKKLQIMDKNVPESSLRNEVIKLLDDKTTYQNTAKDALRKVYQERCEAMQMLAKMEAAYAIADNECKLLREQITNTNMSMHDVNVRLLGLESEYNNYKEESTRQLQEAREQEEMRRREFKEVLQQREMECEDLRRRIDELSAKHLEDDENLQKQAIEKLDQAIADMDLGEDDDDDDDDDDEYEEDGVIDPEIFGKHMSKSKHKKALLNANDVSVLNLLNNMSGQEKEGALHKEAKQVVNKSTIFKWLKNSELINKEGSLEIFDAICNESDSSDEEDNTSSLKQEPKKLNIPEQFSSKLQFVQNNLQELEAQISHESAAATAISDEDEEPSDEVSAKQRTKSANKMLKMRNKSYALLKTSAGMLRELHNEFYNFVKHYEAQQREKLNEQDKESQQEKDKPQLPPQPNPHLPQLQLLSYQHYDQELSPPPTDLQSKSDSKQQTLEALESMGHDDDLLVQAGMGHAEDDESCSVGSFASSTPPTTRAAAIPAASSQQIPREEHEDLKRQVQEYQQRIIDFNVQVEQKELEFQQTLEIMQIESDSFREKVAELDKLVATLRQEKEQLQQQKLSDQTEALDDQSSDYECALMNNASVQREEELILYKERLEEAQMNNLQLQSQIEQIQRKTANAYKFTLMTRVLPVAAVAVVIVAVLMGFR